MTLEELVVKLVLDVAGFEQGQRDAENATGRLKQSVVADAKATEAAVAKVTAGVEALGRKFLGLYALVMAGRGLREFVSDPTSADSALGRTAKNVDLGEGAVDVAARGRGLRWLRGRHHGGDAELERGAAAGRPHRHGQAGRLQVHADAARRERLRAGLTPTRGGSTTA